jgi:phosphohistidine phosphatase
MALFLVQHGKSLSKDKDPDQSLSEEGRIEVEYIAHHAKEHGIQISSIQHSGKTRARQTAEIFATALNPDDGIQEIGGLKPLDDVTKIAKEINNIDDNPLLVGHLPFMAKLTSYLIIGSVDKPVLKFQNGGIVCLDQENGDWFIKWTLMPKM